MDFKIRGQKLGYDCPVYVIAEGCDNHMGNVETAKQMALLAGRGDA
jgi:N-acetylneuraminate synthase